MKTLIEHIDASLARHQHGWCEPVKAHALAAIIVAIRPAITVEIGVYAGKSAISMALAHRHIGSGKVIGIDPYSNEAAIEGQPPEHAEWWKKLNMNDILHLFEQEVKANNVQDYIQLVRATSDDIEPEPVIDLLHIDGNHSDQAVRDVSRFACNVRVGGMVVADDVNWPGGGVTKAVTLLKEMGFIKLYDVDSSAVFQRVFQTPS